MKFSLIIAAAAGAIAAPHASPLLVSAPAYSVAPAAPSHSVSLPAHSVPSCKPDVEGVAPSVTPAWGAVAPTEAPEEEEHEIEVEAEPVPGHEVEVEVESEHGHKKGGPVAEVCKTVFVVVEEVKELVAGDIAAISEFQSLLNYVMMMKNY